MYKFNFYKPTSINLFYVVYKFEQVFFINITYKSIIRPITTTKKFVNKILTKVFRLIFHSQLANLNLFSNNQIHMHSIAC